MRSVLGALVSRGKGRSSLDTTVWQVAQSAGLSEKWTARCLYILEGLGVIYWQRGFIEDGKPRPGLIQIVKRTLLDLVRQAWNQQSEAWAVRRAATARRLALLKKQTGQIRRSRRPELSEDLNALNVRGGAIAPATTHMSEPVTYLEPVTDLSTMPQWARKEEGIVNDTELCEHGYVASRGKCPHCKRLTDSKKRKGKNRGKPDDAWKEARKRKIAEHSRQLNAEAIRNLDDYTKHFYLEHSAPAGMSIRDYCMHCENYHPPLKDQELLKHLREYAPGAYREKLKRLAQAEQATRKARKWSV